MGVCVCEIKIDTLLYIFDKEKHEGNERQKKKNSNHSPEQFFYLLISSCGILKRFL